jgi:RNA-directed DNA polymerase
MNDRGKSDGLVVPAKPPNNTGAPGAEAVEGRGSAEGNAASKTRAGRRAGQDASSALDRVRRRALDDKEARFSALLHHVDADRLGAAYRAINPRAATGTDGVTWSAYGQNLEGNLEDLLGRVHRGGYRAKPARRTYIPKPDGRQRPLGIAALEDKILQRAVVEVLNAIYEADFLGFSYGFRPGRSAHDALDALAAGIYDKKVNWVLDADIRDFFGSLDHGWLMKFLEHRVSDRRVLRLIQKWLSAGVIEDGAWSETERGTAQGASASPLLANVYLHYAFDLWAHRWRGRHASGDVVIVRYADDYIIGFQHQRDAQRFLAGLRETFDFLGFKHICSKTKNGRFMLKRITVGARMQAKLREIRIELRRRRHHPIPAQGEWLGSVVRGHMAYYAVPGNADAMIAFHDQVTRHWHKSLKRRSQRHNLPWTRMHRIADRWLPPVKRMHPFPNARFNAKTQGRSPVR